MSAVIAHNIPGDAVEIHRTLKDDFFPGYMYATVNMSNHPNQAFPGDPSEAFGTFMLDGGDKGKVYAMFKSDSNKNQLSDIEWTNKACQNNDNKMCLIRKNSCNLMFWWDCRYVCRRPGDCNSPWHMV